MDSLGYIDHHTGHHHEAIAHYRRAVTLRRDAGDAYQSADTLAQLYREQERHEDVQRVQRQLNALGPPGAVRRTS